MMTEALPFTAAANYVGLDISGMRVEGFRTDGTSNYLANLNCGGQTWAGALRMPAIGVTERAFISEKSQALVAVSYLLDILGRGLTITPDLSLIFGGISTLVSGLTTQAFLRDQGHNSPLMLIDEVGVRKRIVKGMAYPTALSEDTRDYVASYNGPFYLSRGAPAWETLEEYPELNGAVAGALAALHRHTGLGSPVPEARAAEALERIDGSITVESTKWEPTQGSKEERALTKSLTKWQGHGNQERGALIRKERFLRTTGGRELYRQAFRDATKDFSGGRLLRCFCHGDAHGGNFILVRYQYDISDTTAALDRVFLNEILEAHPKLNRVYVGADESGSRITYSDKPVSAPKSYTATRRYHHEVHPIDLDSGRGVTPDTRELHLYDAMVYAISLASLTTLFGSPRSSLSILGDYYKGLSAMS